MQRKRNHSVKKHKKKENHASKSKTRGKQKKKCAKTNLQPPYCIGNRHDIHSVVLDHGFYSAPFIHNSNEKIF